MFPFVRKISDHRLAKLIGEALAESTRRAHRPLRPVLIQDELRNEARYWQRRLKRLLKGLSWKAAIELGVYHQEFTRFFEARSRMLAATKKSKTFGPAVTAMISSTDQKQSPEAKPTEIVVKVELKAQRLVEPVTTSPAVKPEISQVQSKTVTTEVNLDYPDSSSQPVEPVGREAPPVLNTGMPEVEGPIIGSPTDVVPKRKTKRSRRREAKLRLRALMQDHPADELLSNSELPEVRPQGESVESTKLIPDSKILRSRDNPEIPPGYLVSKVVKVKPNLYHILFASGKRFGIDRQSFSAMTDPDNPDLGQISKSFHRASLGLDPSR